MDQEHTFAVYQQLNEDQKSDINRVKTILYTAFATDSFEVYEPFMAKHLCSGKSDDIYLAEF